MDFELLDCESEKQLKALLSSTNIAGKRVQGTAIENLILGDYVVGNAIAVLSSTGPDFILTRLTHKGKTYFENKANYAKEKKKLAKREWKIAIFCTLGGGLLGLIPTFLQVIGLLEL